MAPWRHFRLTVLLVALASGWQIGEATASRVVERPLQMGMADPVLAPFGYVLMCRDHPSACEAGGQPVALEGSEEQMDLLAAVNREVNDTIIGVAKATLAWNPSAMAGDCNDYAAGKRRRLIEAGIPPGALFFAVARTPGGDTHNVLVVRTQRGDWVLDNLRRDVRQWHRAGYTWLMRQSDENPRLWHKVVARRMPPMPTEYPLLAAQVPLRLSMAW